MTRALVACTESALSTQPYVGRFAPSPSGPLHAGSLVAALASYLDARAHHGRWIIRIEDVDTTRAVPGADSIIIDQLRALGMQSDADIWYQSERSEVYAQTLDQLARAGLVYGCGCTRAEIAAAARAAGVGPQVQELPYLGMCRSGLAPGRAARAQRVRMPDGIVSFEDRWLGPQSQDVAREVGDMVIRRADGLWAYQLAVVVDDAAQGVTDVVRGADLLSSTARQQVLARLLGVAVPSVMHVPLVIDPISGLKLSKQNHAPALDVAAPLQALELASNQLGLPAIGADSLGGFWRAAVPLWAARFGIHQSGT